MAEKPNALERIIIQRKTLIKSINSLTKERNKAREENRTEDMRVLNARLSERHTRYNDIVKTQKFLEEHFTQK